MKKSYILIIFTALFFLGSGLFAQSPQVLNFGVPTSGKLSSGSEVWYSLRPAQTGLAVIETKGETDIYLEAYDAERNLIEENDDGGEGYNAKIEMLVSAGATYLIKVRCYDSSEEGAYTISATQSPLPAITELNIGNRIPQVLSANKSLWYSVKATQKGIITVETSGDTDTFMDVYNSSFVHISSDDDSGDGYNAKIEVYAEPDQVLYFKVKGYESDVEGLFSIVAVFSTIPEDTLRNTERSRAVSVTLGEAMSVFFYTPGESRWYKYEAKRDDTHFVVQTRGGVDTIMNLYDSGGNKIAEDDDSGDGNNALISQRLSTGTYYIEVKQYSRSSRMERCTLHAETR